MRGKSWTLRLDRSAGARWTRFSEPRDDRRYTSCKWLGYSRNDRRLSDDPTIADRLYDLVQLTANAQRMTPSRFRCKQTCDRLHWYQYELGIRPRKSAPPLRFGSLFHAATDPWWRAHKDRKPDHALDHARDALSTYRPYEMDDFTFAAIAMLVIGYNARYAPSMDRIDVLEVEAEYTAPLLLPNTNLPIVGWKSAGKIDVIVAGGKTVVGIETKTSAADLSPGSFYWAKLAMDPQLSSYFDGALHLTNGHKYQLDRFTYDVIAKPKIKPGKATAEVKMTKGKACGTKANPCEGKACYRCGGRGFKPCGTDKNPCGGVDCERCPGTGYQSPRPNKGQRLTDETLDQYRARLLTLITENPAAWYHRQRVPRTDQDMKRYRREYARAALECTGFRTPADWLQRTDYGRNISDDLSMKYWPPPRNLNACAVGSSVCAFFDVCQGAKGLDSPDFVQIGPHPELNS